MATPQHLSPHFTLEEFTRSQVATRLGIRNVPGARAIKNLRRVAEFLLEPLRKAAGAIFISSGFRCNELSLAIGSSDKSQHGKGLAADIVCSGLSALDLCRLIISLHLPFDQLIYEGGWVHVSMAEEGSTPRGQVLTAHFNNGKVSYTAGLPRDAGDAP